MYFLLEKGVCIMNGLSGSQDTSKHIRRRMSSLERNTARNRAKKSLGEDLRKQITEQTSILIRQSYLIVLGCQSSEEGRDTDKALREMTSKVIETIAITPKKSHKNILVKMLLDLNNETTHDRDNQKTLKNRVLTQENKSFLANSFPDLYAAAEQQNKAIHQAPIPEISTSPQPSGGGSKEVPGLPLAAASAARTDNPQTVNKDTLAQYIGNSPPHEVEDRKTVVAIIKSSGGLTTEEPLVFEKLKHLTCFPEGFNPQGMLMVMECPSFTGFPKGFKPQKDVGISECASFKNFPEGFAPQGEVAILKCALFTGFPESFNCPKEKIVVAECPEFKGFDENFNPKKDVIVSGSRRMYGNDPYTVQGYDSIENINFKEYLQKSPPEEVSDRKRVMETMEYAKNLHPIMLLSYPTLTRLPEGLKNKTVTIIDADKLQFFNTDFQAETLSIKKCPKLESVPLDQVRNLLRVSNCAAFCVSPHPTTNPDELVIDHCQSFPKDKWQNIPGRTTPATQYEQFKSIRQTEGGGSK